MASFDPREWMKKEEEPLCIAKLPLHKLEPTLRKFINVAIPTDLQRLQKHQVNIERHIYTESWRELNIEQINASRTVQQLRATIRELDKTKNQIREEDVAAFERKIAPIKKQAIDAIQCFGDLEKSLMQKLSNKENHQGQNIDSSQQVAESRLDDPVQDPVQLQTQHDLTTEDAEAASASWDELRDSLVDLNGIIHDFSEMVHQQQEKVDSISDNIESSHSNVRSAVLNLGQASKLKAAMIPITGAVVGGLIAGPIGLLAGFKLAGVAAAVGGSVAGYQGGRMIKKRHDHKIETELETLSGTNVPMKAIKDKSA
eukprot:gene17563-19315_t